VTELLWSDERAMRAAEAALDVVRDAEWS